MNMNIFKIQTKIFYNHSRIFKVLFKIGIFNSKTVNNISFYSVHNSIQAQNFNKIAKKIGV